MSPRRNRVDPWGDLHAVDERGMFTGNRGCLVDASGDLVRHHRGNLWITCRTSFRGWRHPLDEPGTWTPLFFLDDSVALAAGHRPCGLCRPDAYTSFRDALTRALGRDEPFRAVEMNRCLAAERLRRGSGLDRAGDRKLWTAPLEELPDGTVVVDDVGRARLVVEDRTLAFRHCGWTAPTARPTLEDVRVLTPPTSVAALRHGFDPDLHPSSRS
ncbi:MAG TPA: hypothetical protein VKH17_08055 [Acidimicrobiia bacterium]|nr:hypothetical protein [Acidimicrobiia bacterium]